MPIDISNLTQLDVVYPKLIGKVMRRESVLQYMTMHLGATPGRYYFKLWQPSTNFQECCTIPEGHTELEEREANVVCVSDGDSYCELDLNKILREVDQKWGAGKEKVGTELANTWLDQQLNSTEIAIDRLTFLGDTASTDKNLNRTDGFIKLARQGTDPAQELALTGTPYEMLQEVAAAYLDEPDAYLFGDVLIFCGYDFAGYAQMQLANLDLYHYNPGVMDNFKPFNIPGMAKIRIIPCAALNGTGILFASPERNMHWLTNVEADKTTLLWDYSTWHQAYFWRLKFVIGYALAFPEYCVIGTYTKGSLTIPKLGKNVNITGPLNADGTALMVEQIAAAVVAAAQNINAKPILPSPEEFMEYLNSNPDFKNAMVKALVSETPEPTDKPKRVKQAKPADETPTATEKPEDSAE